MDFPDDAAALTLAVAAPSPSPADPLAADGATCKKRKFAHTNEAQRRAMLEWLERPGNFGLLMAPAGANVANGKKVKKTDGFRALMRHVNAETGAHWSMDMAKSRFESLCTSYKKIKRQALAPAFAVTENDRARGLHDVAQKRNALCLFYDRIDALFEPTVAPSAAGEEVAQDVAAVATDELKEELQEVVPEPVQVEVVTTSEDPRGTAMPLEAPNVAPTAVSEEPAEEARDEKDKTDVEAPPASEEVVTAVTLTDDVTLQQLALERERLDLLQEQLRVQRLELELKERELKQQEDDKRTALRAELTVKLAEAGKSIDEIRELLALIQDP